MHSASPSFDLISPLKALWHWLLATPGQNPRLDLAINPPVSAAPPCTSTFHSQLVCPPASATSHSHVRRPLRMVRVMEAGQSSSLVGRMVISGRMADVCAELDRLAAFEAQLH